MAITKQKSKQSLEAEERQYTVKQGDGLMAIVRREYDLKDPKDTKEINRLVNLIVEKNAIKDANKIKAGDKLKLPARGGNQPDKEWRYTVKQGDGLMAIVRKEFNLKDPKDTKEIARLVELIVKQNNIKNRNRIEPGDVLTLRNYKEK